MAWKTACQSSSRSGGPQLSSTLVVSMKVRNTPSSPLEHLNSSTLRGAPCLENLPVECGPDRFDRFRVLLQFADPHDLVVVHLDGPPWFIRYLRSALLLKFPSTGTYTRLYPARLLVRQKLESAYGILARTLWRSVGPKHLLLAGVCAACLTKTPFGFIQLYWPPHAAHHQFQFSRQ